MEEKDFIENELSQILASRLLDGKKQACNFLTYIVAETLAGRGEKITQYGIAIEALGKPDDFCPTDSPAVRVEAGRVRKLLETYYATEGKDSKIRIILPSGSYQPVFDSMAKSEPLVVQHFGPKSIQSLGPKVHICYPDTALIRDDSLRGLVYNMRSMLPMVMGNFREVRIALARISPTKTPQGDELDIAWRQHQAEFLLQCTAEIVPNGFDIRFALFHTLTHEVVWSDSAPLPAHHTQQTLETIFSQLIQETFSLHRGVAMAYWSRYWKTHGTIPSHYQVLVEHVAFIQDNAGETNLQPFMDACQTRTQRYHDDALAHLHYAVLCLYAYMFRGATKALLTNQWHRLALRALELNPGNALAHSIFALECFHRGDYEMGQVEIETARQVNPYDTTIGHLMAVGLCALRQWERAFTLMRDIAGLNSGYPDPLRTIPCLFYFRRGEFARIAANVPQYAELGGWETFGKLTTHCRTDDCKGCIHTLSTSVDKANNHHKVSLLAAQPLWKNIKQRLSTPAPPLLEDMPVQNTTLQ
ncbi:tetratricopeptide repeat protein [Thiothrix lacustris]|uniref:tetratricopeptide repeat protein n=1 Tax=Thiothrix lacustris TaxID=525917 RepID=UPI0027E464C6|nr:hypothetical protein [Thiothrix lacustris]WMP19293.1 hypothetical protein RCS87_09640 [Thiothrix lacustris]